MRAWFRVIVAGVVAGQASIDPAIQAALPAEWPLARLDNLLRAVLRAAVFELAQRRDVPAKVVVNEYLDVARAFFGDEETGLINKVLDRIGRIERPQEMARRRKSGAASDDGQEAVTVGKGASKRRPGEFELIERYFAAARRTRRIRPEGRRRADEGEAGQGAGGDAGRDCGRRPFLRRRSAGE